MDDERLIKQLNQFGKMYNDMKPGLAERIKQQIPENLGGNRQSSQSFKAVMNHRVGKLVAAAVIAGEVILLLCVFGGDDLSEEIYMQEKYYITKYFKPCAKTNWNKFVNHIEKYRCSNELPKQIFRGKAVKQEKITPERQKQQPANRHAGKKEIQNTGTKGLIATAKPNEKDQKTKWSDILKAGKTQESIEEETQRNAQAAVDALWSFARLAGTYPDELSIMTVIQKFREAYKERQPGKSIPEDQRYRQLADTTKKLKWLCNFYEELYKHGNDPAYYGHKLESRKADAVLMRWRLVTGEYQVIFGNLRTEIVTSEQLELLEKFENNSSHL